MAFALSDIRSDLDALLATAVDSSTWTTALKDEAARQALRLYDAQAVYETDFTVANAGAQQDLSGLAALRSIRGLAWPWAADAGGESFARRAVRWRTVGDQTVCIEADGGAQPQAGDTIRVRYTKLHTLNGLDGAAATTVPDRHRRVLAVAAAAWACLLRMRQLSENPAAPGEAPAILERLEAAFRRAAEGELHAAQAAHPVRWEGIGL